MYSALPLASLMPIGLRLISVSVVVDYHGGRLVVGVNLSTGNCLLASKSSIFASASAVAMVMDGLRSPLYS